MRHFQKEKKRLCLAGRICHMMYTYSVYGFFDKIIKTYDYGNSFKFTTNVTYYWEGRALPVAFVSLL